MRRSSRLSIDNLIQTRFERGKSGRLLHVRLGSWILQHRFKVLHASPLGLVGDLGAIQAAMNVGGNKPGQVAHGSLCRVDQQIDQRLLLGGFNGEDVDESNEFVFFVDGGHRIVERNNV